jgi:hypothetical protein
MPVRRCRLQFSLRFLLVVLTVFFVWLGVAVNRAREQREAVKAIEALGGTVVYDWEPELEEIEQLSVPHHVYFRLGPRGQPHGAPWLRRLIGDDYFQHVEQVISPPKSIYDYSVSESDVHAWIPVLQKLSGVKILIVQGTLSDELADLFKAELPSCKIIHERGFLDSPEGD